MPDMPKTVRPIGQRSARERNADHDKRREISQPWRAWYDLAIWRHPVKGIRARQLAAFPLCQRCQAEGKIAEATVCNHVGGHGGDFQKFLQGPFESLCKTHHDSDVQREEIAARKEVKT